MADNGNLVFRTDLQFSPTPTTFSAGAAIYSERVTNRLTLIAQTGGIAPGTGTTFFSLSQPAINNRSQVAFVGSTGNNSNRTPVLYSEAGGNGLELIVSSGDFAPGTDRVFTEFNAPEITNSGKLVFRGLLNTVPTGTSIYVHDPTEGLRLIIRSTDQIDVSSNPATPEIRTVSSVSLSGKDGIGKSPNGTDRFVFEASFTTGRGGIFTVDLPDGIAGNQGDFDSDADVDIADVDLLISNIGNTSTTAIVAFDLNGDGEINAADLRRLIETLVETDNGFVGSFLGDFNLDGRVGILGDGFTLITNLGRAVSSYSLGDANGDRSVDILGDGFQLINNLGRSND